MGSERSSHNRFPSKEMEGAVMILVEAQKTIAIAMRMPAESAAEGPIRENNGKRESRCVMRKIGTKMANITPTREFIMYMGRERKKRSSLEMSARMGVLTRSCLRR